MKKSLLALALLGAFAGVAQAQSAVIIYGSVDAGVIKRTDTPVTIGKRLNNTLGFKGTEDLGTGLKALFQLEIRYEPDTGLAETGAGNAQRPLFQGQSRVGLQGAFGMVRIGRGLTAFQESSIAFEPFHGIPSPAGFQADLHVAGYTTDPLGTAGNSANRFSNALFYNSNELNVGGGMFQINTTIGTREQNQNPAFVGRGTVAAPQYPANAAASAMPYSMSMTWKSATGGLMLAQERNAVESKLWSIAGSVMTTPEMKLMASMTRQNQDHTKIINTRTKAWVVGANYTMGANKFLAGYGQKAPDGLAKVKQFSLGYEYSMSKRTYIYVDASNKKGATPVSVNHFDVGVNHSF
jgi:predicted porin